jgi:hypothetical protein
MLMMPADRRGVRCCAGTAARGFWGWAPPCPPRHPPPAAAGASRALSVFSPLADSLQARQQLGVCLSTAPGVRHLVAGGDVRRRR